MRIRYKGSHPAVLIALEDAIDVLESEEFYNKLKGLSKFNCTEKSSEEIAQIIKNSTLEVELKLYKSKWRYSKVLGFFSHKSPNKIFLNSRKLQRASSSISNTIVHEYIHAVDTNNNRKKIEFGHNCETKKNTAPYSIGSLAEVLIEGKEMMDFVTEVESKAENYSNTCLVEYDGAEFLDVGFELIDDRIID